MAAKTLTEIINERNFRTAAEKMAFAFGWNAAMDIMEAQNTSTNRQRDICAHHEAGARCLFTSFNLECSAKACKLPPRKQRT
jgi:hypothetical protein